MDGLGEDSATVSAGAAGGADAPADWSAGRRRLTEREIVIVRQIAEGRTNKQIAEALALSPATVKRHVSNVLIKWNCANRAHVAALAVQRLGVACH